MDEESESKWIVIMHSERRVFAFLGAQGHLGDSNYLISQTTGEGRWKGKIGSIAFWCSTAFMGSKVPNAKIHLVCTIHTNTFRQKSSHRIFRQIADIKKLWVEFNLIFVSNRVASRGPDPCKNPTRTQRFRGRVGSGQAFYDSGFFGSGTRRL